MDCHMLSSTTSSACLTASCFLQAPETSHLHAKRSNRGHAKQAKEEAMALLPPSFLLFHHTARNMELEDAIDAVLEWEGEFAEVYFPVEEEAEN
ncbi:hypothetical protein BCR44DRAFT_34094 [Catenaria anguillulae PL171]|uniref:Uncharacterized protein n=1 Tax=Catenaria anguillulae PL171 TaxID=765915 RepID=A0A1Y2HUK0_9FUNG|nr:hypothetical protein BCR44DRAFT_34094 [Catenaria anguillulae PL171]